METAGILIVIIIVLFFSVERLRSISKAWKNAAEHLGLEYVKDSLFSNPSMRGHYRGFLVVIDMETRGSGRHSRTVTVFHVFYTHDLQLGLKITKTNLLTGVGKFFGAQDIEVQDSGFDDLAVIKGRNPEEIKIFLRDERRKALRKLLEKYNNVEISDREIKLEINGGINSPFTIKEIVESLVPAAEIMVRDQDRS